MRQRKSWWHLGRLPGRRGVWLTPFFLERWQEFGKKGVHLEGSPGLFVKWLMKPRECKCVNICTDLCRQAGQTPTRRQVSTGPETTSQGRGLIREKTGSNSKCSSLPLQPHSFSTLYESEMGQRRVGRCVMFWLFPDLPPSAPEAQTAWS